MPLLANLLRGFVLKMINWNNKYLSSMSEETLGLPAQVLSSLYILSASRVLGTHNELEVHLTWVDFDYRKQKASGHM